MFESKWFTGMYAGLIAGTVAFYIMSFRLMILGCKVLKKML